MAASAIMWLDEANSSAEFEPVGTHPGYRRRGLARAMMLHGMHRARAAGAMTDALDAFPALADRLDQPAGTLSGGEQQMLALARVMMTHPRLLLIDELALGLAPMTVDLLMAMVRRINEEGTTVILVEQSINRAISLAQRCFFIERGEIRFDGPTAELLARDDLLRPVFLGTATVGLG